MLLKFKKTAPAAGWGERPRLAFPFHVPRPVVAVVSAEVCGQLGMVSEVPIRSNRSSEGNAGFRHGRGDDVGILAFLGDPLMEEIAVRAPSFQCRLHRVSRYRQIEEP